MSKLYLDSETCGFAGFPVTFQYAIDDAPETYYEIWHKSVNETLRLIEMFCEHDFVGFNCVFDWFHVTKAYNVLKVYAERYPNLANDPPNIDLVASCEEAAMDGVALKPRACSDLMLWSRKDQRTQTLMNRGDVRIRKVPMELAYPLADELDARLELPEVYWQRQADKTVRWRVYDIDEEPYFKDVVLKFNPSAGLKYLMEYFVGEKPPFHFGDIACEVYPKEVEYAPSARAVYELYGDDALAWPDVIQAHIDHWHTNADAIAYAKYDVYATRRLYQYFGCPEAGDDDSELACMVATVRWHGFAVDLAGISELRDAALKVIETSPINVDSTSQVRQYLMEVMDVTEQIFIAETTRKKVLEEIATWTDNTEAAHRAKTILGVRKMQKEIELYDKLILARRLHAGFNVIGAVSSRMSGGSGLNVQGINRTTTVRRCFPLAWGDMTLSGGDFSKFEMAIADAVYKDPSFRELVVGKLKPAAVFGELMYPHLTYAEILASEGKDPDYYTAAKSGLFAVLYFGEAFTLHVNQGIPLDVAERAITEWRNRAPGLKKSVERIVDTHSALVENGHGFTWVDPQPFAENMQGFKRSFELEITVMKVLYALAISPPKEWDQKKIKVVRRQKIQTAAGAVRSALYGAAFSIQNANIRAAGNHEIQSTGALICKKVERAIWNLQPTGIGPFVVAPMQIHDEIQCVCAEPVVDAVTEVVGKSIAEQREALVPLLGMAWSTHAANWAEGKKGGRGETYSFTYDPEKLVALS
jgi:DNA polymerase I-like protein with 3'-5' exonuclease and polymerase domains